MSKRACALRVLCAAALALTFLRCDSLVESSPSPEGAADASGDSASSNDGQPAVTDGETGVSGEEDASAQPPRDAGALGEGCCIIPGTDASLGDASLGDAEPGDGLGSDSQTSTSDAAEAQAGDSAAPDANGPDVNGPDAPDSGASVLPDAETEGGSIEGDGGAGLEAGLGTLCAGCGTGSKTCPGKTGWDTSKCVSTASVLFGCASSSCSPCPTPPHAQAGCSANGACGVGACEPGWADCNGNPADGCEADLKSPATCAGCATACGGATPLCSAAGCAAACASNEALCTDRCVDLQSAPYACRACATACPAATGAFPACSAGVCTSTCPPGEAMCGSGSTAHCASLQSDPQNCGACGNACAAPQSSNEYVYAAAATCTAGVCGLGCQGGWSSCDGVCVTTQTDPVNCGACGHACPAGDLCVQSACVSPSSVWIATGLPHPTELAVDDAHVYWLDPTAGAVGVVSKSGGPIALLAQNQMSPAVLAVDDASVYWQVGSGTGLTVMRAAKDGSSPPTVAVAPGTLGSAFLGIDSAFVYTTAFNYFRVFGTGATLMQTPKSGGTSTSIAFAPTHQGVLFIGVSDAGVYWRGEITYYLTNLTTGVTTSVGAQQNGDLTVVTDGQLCTGIFFNSISIPPAVVCAPSSWQTYWYLYPLYDNAAHNPAHLTGVPARSIARNQCGAFWSAAGIQMAVDGAPFAAVIDPFAHPTDVAVDDAFVYWTDPSGAIGKLPIPTSQAGSSGGAVGDE